jgi:hypothetical protein
VPHLLSINHQLFDLSHEHDQAADAKRQALRHD